MLSPHEISTLMLVRQSPDLVDIHRTELDTLVERRLIALDAFAEGRLRVSLTKAGRRVLDALRRIDPAFDAERGVVRCEPFAAGV